MNGKINRGRVVKRIIDFWEWAKEKGEFTTKEAVALFQNSIKILIMELCKNNYLIHSRRGRYIVNKKNN